MTRRISTCFLGFALFVGPLVRAADFGAFPKMDKNAVRVWRATDGLPSDSVTAILQTHDGYLWVGTSRGLVRFDGVKFNEIELTANPTNGPASITALCEDSSGRVWVGTQNDGLFELKPGAVRRHTKREGLLDDSVTSLAADNQGFVWIGTRAGLNLAAGGDFRGLTTQQGLPDNLITGVHVARSGTVWVITRSGMSRFVNGQFAPYALQTDSQGRRPEYLGVYEDRRGNLWAYGDTYLINLAEAKRFNYFRGNEAASVRIWSLCEGRDGRLWIGTTGRGLFCFDDQRFQPVNLGELPGPSDVRAICEDREGNLWLGTSGGGLVQMRPQPVHIARVGEGLPASPPTALALAANGRLLVGLQHGGVFANDAGRFDRFAGGGLDVQESVTSLAAARDGTLWAGTLGGGLYGLRGERTMRFTTMHGLGDDAVLAVGVAADGGVWAGTRAGTLHRITSQRIESFNPTHGLNGAPITALLPAGDSVWLGTATGVVLRGAQGKFNVVPTTKGFFGHAVATLYAGDAGELWIGTAGAGLACLVNNRCVVWNSKDGLPDDVVAGVTEDGEKNLWLATGSGVHRIERGAVARALTAGAPLECKLMSNARTVLETKLGLGGVRVLASAEGQLWFATTDGVLNVDTRRSASEAAPLPVYIESLAFNGHPPRALWTTNVALATALTLPSDVRSLEIQFSALHFTAPERVRFQRKLEGYDLDWVGEGGERFARFSRLPYGNYRFRVAARLGDGPWQEAANPLAFVVPTPLYLRSWAIALYVFAAVALVAVVVRIISHRRLRLALARLEQQQSLERERMRIARDLHDEMGSKLTKISFLSEHVKMDAAQTGPLVGKVASIAETSRDLLKTMDEIVWVVNPRNDTLEHLAAYLSHHAEEYFQNTSIECEMKLPRTMPEHPLSSEARHNLFLAFEEALNNVLKHSGASRVKIEMLVNAADFAIIVSDNGRGFEPATRGAANITSGNGQSGRGGNGLRNMRQRLADIGGECVVVSQTGQGTTVTLRLPLDSKNVKEK